MVIKICKICGKEFDAKGRAKTCSPECSKINRKNYDKDFYKNNRDKKRECNKQRYINNRDKILEQKREYYENNRDEILEYKKEWYDDNRDKILEQKREYYENNRDKILEQKREYYENNRDKILEQGREYYENNRDEILERRKESIQNKIAELNEKFDGDLELILKDCPNSWMVREAIMQVEYGVSYSEAMYQKMKGNPICEVTGVKNDLVIHHIKSFNIHPELGADLDNLVRIKSEIHDEFHNIYGRGNNTDEQWNEFIRLYGFRKFF